MSSKSASLNVSRLRASIDAKRLEERTLDLVRLPSPSGQEGAAAALYAQMLSDAGLDVQIDEEFPESPSVIARSPGGRRDRRRVLQLDGHLDTVSTPHQPPYVANGVIVGRGACDMKGGLAVIAEVVQVLAEADVELNGSLLVTAHGQHEEAVGGRSLHAPLIGLLNRGVVGDACLIPEGPHREVPIAGRGLLIFTLVFRREGEPVHEILGGLRQPPPNPIDAVQLFLSRMSMRSREWPRAVNTWTSGESFFVGAVHSGDFYNRIPTSASMWGTRRYPSGQTFRRASEEIVAIADSVADSVGCEAIVEFEESGQPFVVEEEAPIVRALRESYLGLCGRELPLGGIPYSADASQFVNRGGIAAVYHGTNSDTAHSDTEQVSIADLERCAAVMLGAVVNYLVGR